MKRSIEKAVIGILNGTNGKVHHQALYRILSQTRPCVRGIYSRKMALLIAMAMKDIGYKIAFVVHGRSKEDLIEVWMSYRL